MVRLLICGGGGEALAEVPAGDEDAVVEEEDDGDGHDGEQADEHRRLVRGRRHVEPLHLSELRFLRFDRGGELGFGNGMLEAEIV